MRATDLLEDAGEVVDHVDSDGQHVVLVLDDELLYDSRELVVLRVPYQVQQLCKETKNCISEREHYASNRGPPVTGTCISGRWRGI